MMKRLTAIFFLSVIMIFTCLVFAGILIRAADRLTTPLNDVNDVNIDWRKLSLFKDSANYVPEPKVSLFTYIKDKIEKYTSDKIAGNLIIIQASRSYEELIGWNIAVFNEYNPIIKLKDGYLHSLIESKDVSENAESIRELHKFCRDLGIEYAYINFPVKICTYEDRGISGILDYSNQNADRLLDAISKAGVKCYDFRKILHEDGINHHKAFFRTDHHWKPETGLWAAKHILEFLRDDYGWEVDPEILNPDKFEHKIYPEWFLGSQGKKLTLARTKPDDFTILYPKFRTMMHFEVPMHEIDASGDFSVTYNMKHAERKDYYALNTYAAYKYADQPLTRIHNMLNHDGKKILFIHDSMSNCVIPFIALGIEYIDETGFALNIKKYIKFSKPDMVITAYYSANAGKKNKRISPAQKF